MPLDARAEPTPLGSRGAAKFGGEEDDGIFQQAAPLEIGEQAGDGLVHLGGELAVVFLELGM